jgi:hypothetical protein
MNNKEAEQFMEWVKARVPEPKREWVGLTDGEIEYLFEKFDFDGRAYFRALVKDIAEKLKEKNT